MTEQRHAGGAARPGRGLWAAWGLTAGGGLAFLLGLVLALRDPCVDLAAAEVAAACNGVRPEVVALTLGGTLVAVLGGLLATVVALRAGRGAPSDTGT
jgi:hypothetical protein